MLASFFLTREEIKKFLLVLIIFIPSCVELDIYLPAFHDIMTTFQVSESKVQDLLTWNFFGLCIAGLICGPLSDSFGRRTPLCVTLTIFLLGSILVLLSDNFDVILFGRFLQGLGSGGCFTLGTAIIFDSFPKRKALRALNQLNAIIPFTMSLAPLLGGYLNYYYGFRSNFKAVLTLVLIALLLSLILFRETLDKKNRLELNTKRILSDIRTIISNSYFLNLTVFVSLLWTAYISFLAFTSIFFRQDCGMSAETYPFVVTTIVGTYVIASLLCNYSIRTRGIPFIKKVGTYCVCTSLLLFLVAMLSFPKNPYFITFASLPLYFAVSWLQTPYFEELMSVFPDMKGMASCMVNSVRLLITGRLYSFSSSFYDGTFQPMGFALFIFLVPALALKVICDKKRRRSSVCLEGSQQENGPWEKEIHPHISNSRDDSALGA